MTDSLSVCLVTPSKQVLDEQVTYASVPAWDGQMGMAPRRAAIVMKLGDGPLRLDFAEGGSRWFFIAGGFAQMRNNRLTLLSDEAVGAEDIVAGNAQKDFEQAQQVKAVDDEQVAAKQRRIERARIMKHLSDRLDNKI